MAGDNVPMTSAGDSAAGAGWAQAWLDGDEALDGTGMALAPALAAGWALKTRAQQAWLSEPALAGRAAEGLVHLCACHDGDRELAALAAWAAGLAELVGGDMAAALQALRAAAAAFDELGQSAPAAQARVPTLIALSMLGRHDEAIAEAEALEPRLVEAGDTLAASKVALNRGSMLMRLDRYAEAAEGYRRAAVGFARVGDLEHSVMADIGLAGALTWHQDFAEAERMASRAQQRAAAHSLPVLQALALGELGQLHLHRGRIGQALQAVEAMVELLQGRAPPQRLLEAERARAETYLAAGLWPETIDACDRLVALADDLSAPIEAAWTRLMRGQARAEAGDIVGAHADLAAGQQAFALAGNAVGVARAQLLDARVALTEADGAPARVSAAAALAHSAIAGLRAAGLARWRLEAELVLAQALRRGGDMAAAGALLAEVAAEAGDGPARAACELARAQLAHVQGRRDAALRHCDEALWRFERLRLQVPGGDMRIASAHDAEVADDLWVRLVDEAGAPPWALLQAIERGRARHLHDELAWRACEGRIAAHGSGGTGGTGKVDDQEDVARLRLNWLQHQAALALAGGGPGGHAAAALQQRLKAAETEWMQRERRAAAAQLPQFELGERSLAARAADPPAELDAVITRLGPDRRLLVYHLDGECWRACIVGPGGCVRRDGRVPGLARRLGSLRLQLDAMRGLSCAGDRHAAQRLDRVTGLLRELHQDLIGPLADQLRGAGQLVIVPHRTLHALPFAALGDAAGPLLDRHELLLAHSVSAWLHAERRPAAAPGPALLFAAGSGQLPAVRAEVMAVAAGWPGGAEVLLDGQATLRCWAERAPQAGTLHLACHASARPDNPAFSGLHLHDGIVTLADVAAMRLRTGLVVLSGCDTMLSRIAPGDEVLGLARGFLLAGARSVVATLWSVRDAVTAELMADFHAACHTGARPPAAMRRAQRRLAERHPHPFYWAPFVVHGAG